MFRICFECFLAILLINITVTDDNKNSYKLQIVRTSTNASMIY